MVGRAGHAGRAERHHPEAVLAPREVPDVAGRGPRALRSVKPGTVEVESTQSWSPARPGHSSPPGPAAPARGRAGGPRPRRRRGPAAATSSRAARTCAARSIPGDRGRQQAFEGEADPRERAATAEDRRGRGRRPRPRRDRPPGAVRPRRGRPVGSGLGAVGLHPPVPGQQPVAQVRRRRGQPVEGGAAGRAAGAAEARWVSMWTSAIASGTSPRSAEQLADAVGAVRGRELDAERRGEAALRSPSPRALDRLGGGLVPPRHSCPGSQAGTARSRLSGARSGTRPATRCSSPPSVSAAWTTLTGSAQRSNARSTSATSGPAAGGQRAEAEVRRTRGG